jgi:hypothetical protein
MESITKECSFVRGSGFMHELISGGLFNYHCTIKEWKSISLSLYYCYTHKLPSLLTALKLWFQGFLMWFSP